jgi:hypothetical protein
MRIVFGHSHFRIKKVQPHEVGLFDKEFNNVTFDLQQKYGHLYWIPFIPLGKIWTVNKGDGKKYVCHPEIEQMLDQNPGRGGKTSIFAWSGFLAIGLVLIFISLAEKVSHYNNGKRYAARFTQAAEDLSEQIDSASADDYFLFNLKNPGQHTFDYRQIPLKVLNTRADEVLLGSFTAAGNYGKSLSDEKDLIDFAQQHTIEDSFWVKKSLLKKAVLMNESDNSNFQGIPLKDYSDAAFKLNNIQHLAGPVVHENYAAPGRSATYFELVNEGFDAHADSLVPMSDSLSCKLSKERDFKTDSAIAVRLFGKGTYVLYFSDKAKRTYAYQLDNSDNRLEITKF